MDRKKLLLGLILVLLSVFNNVVISSDKMESQMHDSINEIEITNSKATEAYSDSFVLQKVNYYAPHSGFVYLAWNIENIPLENSVLWNTNTKQTDGLLYTPMVSVGDTFQIQLRVPLGSKFQYYFWTTKNKEGHYLDYWDLKASGSTVVTNSCPITKNAIYFNAEKKSRSRMLSKGWYLFVFLIVVYILLKLIQRRKDHIKNEVTYEMKILFVGVALIAFHAFARAEIIGVNPLYIGYDFTILLKIIRSSFSDFLFIGGLVAVFLSGVLLVKNVRFKRFLYTFFLFFALFSTIIAFTNITTVIYLGKPFTYQWLYYSDFLGSNDAKSALQENFSRLIVFNLLALSIGMLVLSKILISIYQLLSSRKSIKFITITIITVGVGFLFVRALPTEERWTKGQSANPILTMGYSFLSANSNFSFFTAKLSGEMKPFSPSESSALETPFVVIKDHKVKNVMFIILESAGATYFDEYGGSYNLSPELNKYADQSIIFDQMYAHAPATNRSLVSILGSMYPYLSYKSLTQEAADVDQPTLSSVLKSQGYRTSFFSSADLHFQNCRQFLDHRGFDRIDDFSTIKCGEEFQLDNTSYKEGNGIDDMCLADQLTTWLDEDTTKNFFSMIWTVQGHYPYFFSKDEKDYGVSNYNFNRYLNCIKHDDELIGKVMRALEERGVLSSTLVVVTGDHGEAFGQHGQYGHGTSIYEENLKVPLYFINSTLFHGEHKMDVSGMKDLATTVLPIINIAVPKIWQGRNLLNTVSNEAFYFAPWSDYLFGYRKDNMKYVFNETQNTVEIYDLNTDPNEKTNLFSPAMKGEISKARARVAAWVQFQDKYVKQIRKLK